MNDKTSYWLDRNNIICKVDSEWDGCMDSESWTDRAASKSIIGRSLFEFICDDATRMYMEALLQIIRNNPNTLYRPYRCDSPNAKRYMQMVISREDNLIRIAHELQHSEPQKRQVILKSAYKKEQQNQPIVFEDEPVDQGKYFVCCSLCKYFSDVDKGEWHEVDEFFHADGTSQASISVTYGICPKCIKGM